ncbi:DUF2267 domain-containing protein [Streptomyces sp. FXJ1.4098]|nr:DUF2267 domain-containing protein [Streptomyces sp. FXJ1.4098]
MRYEELTSQVQALAQLPDRRSAERAVRATLETLAERIPDGLADHMAAQLPPEAAGSMRRVAASHEASPAQRAYRRDHGERFDLTGFAGGSPGAPGRRRTRRSGRRACSSRCWTPR